MSTPVQTKLGRAAYEGLEFPLMEFKDELGHDSVQHQAYRQPASIEWVGQKILRTTMRAALLTGLSSWPADTFPRLHDQLEALLRSKPQGRLRHPYYGEVLVQVDSWSRGFDSKLQSGCYLEIVFSERDASAVSPVAEQQGTSDPATTMENTSSAADTKIAAIAPTAGLDTTSTVVAEKLAYLEEEERAATEAYGTLDDVQNTVQTALDSEALEGIEAHDARADLRALSAATWRYAEAYAGPRTNAQAYEVPATQSLAEIAAAVYGDATRTDLLRSANVIPDELFVPVGTVLVVPDARA